MWWGVGGGGGGVGEVGSGGVEGTALQGGISRRGAEKLVQQRSLCGAKIEGLRGGGGGGGAGGGGGDGGDPAHLYTVVAVFPSTMAAQSASFKLNNSGGGLFKLRAAKQNYDLRVLERASSQ